MKSTLLPYLACFTCQTSFRLTVTKKSGEEILEGSLRCPQCKTSYLITSGVPRFLPTGLETVKKNTAERFSYQWHRYTDIPAIFEQQFLDWIAPVQPAFFKNKVVLDAGCGMGRHLVFSSKYGAKAVIGVDLGDSVDVAYANTKHLPHVHIVQADIYHLPFKQFDYIYSIGVLHHLPDPKQGFLSLVAHLKKGGTISAWVYGREGNFVLRIFDPVRKTLFSRLPLPFVHLLSLKVMLGLYPLAKLFHSYQNVLPAAPFLSYLGQFQFRHMRTIVFDQMLAPVAFYLTKDEVEDWLKTAKLSTPLVTWRNQNSWRALGKKR